MGWLTRQDLEVVCRPVIADALCRGIDAQLGSTPRCLVAAKRRQNPKECCQFTLQANRASSIFIWPRLKSNHIRTDQKYKERVFVPNAHNCLYKFPSCKPFQLAKSSSCHQMPPDATRCHQMPPDVPEKSFGGFTHSSSHLPTPISWNLSLRLKN